MAVCCVMADDVTAGDMTVVSLTTVSSPMTVAGLRLDTRDHCLHTQSAPP